MQRTTILPAIMMIISLQQAARGVVAFQRPVRPLTTAARILSKSGTTATAGRSVAAPLFSTTTTTTTTPTVEELLNEQVKNELTASQLYLSAAIWCEKNDYDGMAKYMRSESEEERGHALGFIDFALKKDADLELKALAAPKKKWESCEELWKDLLEAEKENTQNLLKLGDAATEAKDHTVTSFLQLFHLEQVESEDKMATILAKVRDEKKTPGLLRQLDTKLGEEAEEE